MSQRHSYLTHHSHLPLISIKQATVDISSRYDGKIVKLHYATGNMAKVGVRRITSRLIRALWIN